MTAPSPTAKFDAALKRFITTLKQNMKAAEECAVLSLEHFAKHGNPILCQRFLTAMTNGGKNYVRKAAYLKWLQAHGPVTMEGGEIRLDHVQKADGVKFRVTEAKATPFWEFAPDEEQVNWGTSDFVVELKRVAKKYHGKMKNGDDKYVPKDDAAKAMLGKFEKFIAEIPVKRQPPAQEVA